MVSICTMVQSRCWFLQLIFLCCIWDVVQSCDRVTQYSSIRIHKEDAGEIALFLVNVVIHKIGEKLDKGYRCPVYCGVDHVHIYWSNNETKKDHIQTIAKLHRTVRDTSKEQSASSLRHVCSTNRLCRNER